MSKLINKEAKKELQKILANLLSPVKLLFFSQKNACPACTQQHTLLKELVSLSKKPELEVSDFVLDGKT